MECTQFAMEPGGVRVTDLATKPGAGKGGKKPSKKTAKKDAVAAPSEEAGDPVVDDAVEVLVDEPTTDAIVEPDAADTAVEAVGPDEVVDDSVEIEEPVEADDAVDELETDTVEEPRSGADAEEAETVEDGADDAAEQDAVDGVENIETDTEAADDLDEAADDIATEEVEADIEESAEASEPVDTADDAFAIDTDTADVEAERAEAEVLAALEAELKASAALIAEPIPVKPDAAGGAPSVPPLAWAPAEPAPKKSRAGMWVGIAAGTAAVALVASSLILIAPGTSVGGVHVGWLTAGAATDAIAHRLATTTVVLTGPGGDAELTGADLGASVNARELADQAFAEHPLWNVTQWFPASADAVVLIDEDAATSALRAAAPELYTEPTDATLAYDADSVSYITTPAVLGEGIDVDALREALLTAFLAGETRVEFDPVLAPVIADTPTFVAEAQADQLNRIIDTAGFYVGAERTVPVPKAVAASWLTVTRADRGTFEITADEAAIEELVPGLAAAVDREPVHDVVITDSDGKVLREESNGLSGRELRDTSDVAADYAAQLSTGDPVFELPVTETAATTTTLERRIEVNLSQQRTYLFENDTVVASYAISSGLGATPTYTGSYRIFAHVSMQDMGCFEGAPYCTENVPWVSYFNGDQAFHGTYWHSNYGSPMSHGCVNMPISIAKYVYDWAPIGTEVWVHY